MPLTWAGVRVAGVGGVQGQNQHFGGAWHLILGVRQGVEDGIALWP
jgi:hypothetical protein